MGLRHSGRGRICPERAGPRRGRGPVRGAAPMAGRAVFGMQGGAGFALSVPGSGGFVASGTARLAYEFDPLASFALYANHLVSYARSSEDSGIPQEGDDEPFSRWYVGGQLRLRW